LGQSEVMTSEDIQAEIASCRKTYQFDNPNTVNRRTLAERQFEFIKIYVHGQIVQTFMNEPYNFQHDHNTLKPVEAFLRKDGTIKIELTDTDYVGGAQGIRFV